jgi:hypothetical protein
MQGSPGIEEELRFFLPGLSARPVVGEQRLEASLDEAARELEEIGQDDVLDRDIHAHRGTGRTGLHACRPLLSDAGSIERSSGRR